MFHILMPTYQATVRGVLSRSVLALPGEDRFADEMVGVLMLLIQVGFLERDQKK